MVNQGLFDLLGVNSLPHSSIHGVVTCIVTNNNDPQGLGRVKVRFPWLGSIESDWARVATPMAGNGRGLYFLPEVDDEVLVLFERGDVCFPLVIGALWNGKDKAPADNADGKNSVRVLASRSGHVIRFDDSEAAPKVEIIDARSANRIVIDTSNDTITITASKDLVLEAQGEIRLSANEVKIAAAKSADISAGKLQLTAQDRLALQGKPIDLNC